MTITPELIEQHQLTTAEYEKIVSLLGREPSYTELGIFSVMWSEHCSYKSSRIHLKKLPTKGKYVVQGIVKDEQGNAVEGAALHVGKEFAFSDSSGRFQLRVSKHGPYALSVAPNEFLSNIVYEVVTAPAQVRADSDDAAQDIEIIVRQKIVSRANQ